VAARPAASMDDCPTIAPDLTVRCWFNADRPITLAALRGRVVVLVAFQVLCPLSVALGVPLARRIHEAFEPNDVAVIGLHATFEHHDAVTKTVVEAFIREYRLKFPIAIDAPGEAGPIPLTMERYRMRGTPSLMLIDRYGVIRKHAFGSMDDLRVGAEIGALVGECAAAAAVRNSVA